MHGLDSIIFFRTVHAELDDVQILQKYMEYVYLACIR